MLLPFTAKSSETVTKALQPNLEIPDFIPYAAFYDPQTILTKNGELLTILKIDLNKQGLPNEEAEAKIYLRDAIREAVMAHVPSEQFAFWVHVVRNRMELEAPVAPKATFAQQVEKEWMGQHKWHHLYCNVCYVTIIHQGQNAPLLNMQDFRNGLLPSKNREFRKQYIERASEELKDVTARIQASIAEQFRVNQLGFKECMLPDGTKAICSEQLEWLHQLINLEPSFMPVMDTDLSQQLSTHEITFGFNAVEVRARKHRRFSAVLSIKHYHELSPTVLDKFMQLPQEMIICQSFDFIPAKEALSGYKEIKEMLKKSQDRFIAHVSGAADMLGADNGSPVAYARQQTQIMVISDSFAELDNAVGKVQAAISRSGLLSVREDIKLEDCTWAMLPANFEFLRRQHPIPSRKVAGFARLNYYPIGAYSSAWGDPVSVLPTRTKTPYLFHFHRGSNGHTLMFDYNSFPDRMGSNLLHFLLAQASRLTDRMVIFDRASSSYSFVRQMQGQYLRVKDPQNRLSLNPFQLEDSPRNRGFLTAWAGGLLGVSEDEGIRNLLKSAVEQVFALPAGDRSVTRFGELLGQLHSDAGNRFREVIRDIEARAPLFGTEDTLRYDNALTALDIPAGLVQSGHGPMIFAYLLHRLILNLDGRPTLIVVRQAWDLLSHPFFASRLDSLLEMLQQHNAALLLTTSDPENAVKSVITPELVRLAATTLYVPDDVAVDYVASAVGLSEAQEKKLLAMERQKGEFLLKHGPEILTSYAPLNFSSQIAEALLGDAKSVFGTSQHEL